MYQMLYPGRNAPKYNYTSFIRGHLTVHFKPLQLNALKMLRMAKCKDQ